jgi:hypothetical protein
MPVTHVFLVHGYSVRSLDAYAQFPQLLAAAYPTTNIFLSAFDSLDDAITCDDLAAALENHVAALENAKPPRVNIESTAFICHSTGAIITRRWILNRLAAEKSIPSHFISMAGANHGSTLAQLGETMVAYVFRGLSGGTTVGRGVLTDLDYGSDFLLRLNREWLVASNAAPLSDLFQFSMVGDSVASWFDDIIWQTKEPGSDSVVRISGSNLNYSILDADADAGIITMTIPRSPSPFLVLHNYSHTGKIGIIDSVTAATDAPFAAVSEALSVSDQASYQSCVTSWAARTKDWIAANIAGDPPPCTSTIVFHLKDRANRPIDDSFIVLQDNGGAAGSVSPTIVNHNPIQNAAVNASVSFLVKFPAWDAAHPHQIAISARSGSEEIDYNAVKYTLDPKLDRMVMPVQTTYVFVTMNRNTSGTYELYDASNAPIGQAVKPWPPFPDGSIGLIPVGPPGAQWAYERPEETADTKTPGGSN